MIIVFRNFSVMYEPYERNLLVYSENTLLFTINSLVFSVWRTSSRNARGHTHIYTRKRRNAFAPIDCRVSERTLIVGTITSERNIRFQR